MQLFTNSLTKKNKQTNKQKKNMQLLRVHVYNMFLTVLVEYDMHKENLKTRFMI